MADAVNYGVSATNVTATNLAVGTNARVMVSADPRIAAQLAELTTAIAAFEGDPATSATLSDCGDQLAEALAQPAPDKEGVLARLSRIADAAGHTGAIAGAATSLAGLVATIL